MNISTKFKFLTGGGGEEEGCPNPGSNFVRDVMK